MTITSTTFVPWRCCAQTTEHDKIMEFCQRVGQGGDTLTSTNDPQNWGTLITIIHELEEEA